MKLCRRFCLRLQGCRCGQIHPAAPYAPARRNCQQERRQQHAEPAAVLPDAVLPAQDVKIAVPAAVAFPAELPDAAKAGIPIFAMTANAFEEDRQSALKAGMDGHIAKPLDIPHLLQVLADVLKS